MKRARRIRDKHASALLVENSPVFELAMTRVLREFGFSVTVPAQLRSDAPKRFQVVLLEAVTLQENLKGLEETVKRCSTLGPVLLLGREDRIEQVVAGFKAGAAGFVTQTASTRELRSAVLAVAAGRLWCETNLFRRILQYVPAVPYSRQPKLTKREHDVLSYLGLGKSNKEIANNLNVSEQCVKVYVSNLLRKAGSSNRSDLALHAITWGFTQGSRAIEQTDGDPSATSHVPHGPAPSGRTREEAISPGLSANWPSTVKG